MSIQGHNISYRYTNNCEYTLKGISFSLDQHSRIGLVGDNGAGKSTLLKILSGDFLSEGDFNCHMKTAALSQEVEDTTLRVIDLLYKNDKTLLKLRESVESFSDGDVSVFAAYDEQGGWEREVEIEKWLTRFQFHKEVLIRPLSKLSGGEKTKVNLITLLLQNPDILLLDEPTNHLDLKTILWLEEFLLQQKIPYLIISHDREFLDRTTTCTWELEDSGLEVFAGNYSYYRKMKQERYNHQLHLYEVQNRKIHQLKKALYKRKGWAISHQGETGNNGYAPVYEECSNSASKAMRQAKVIESRITSMIEKEEKKKPRLKRKARILFEEESGKAGRNCLTLEGVSKSFEKPLFRDLSLTVKHGERVAVTGSNGSGKTTLLKMITGDISDYEGRIFIPEGVKVSCFYQEADDLDFSNTILDEVTGGNLENQANVRHSLGSAGFIGDMVFKKVGELSPGERSKVALIKAMLSDSKLLILDEPTNHLEISMRESAEEALENYRGTIVFVSHDRRFVQKLATRELNLEEL